MTDQAFAEFRDKRSDQRRKKYQDIFLISLGIASFLGIAVLLAGPFLFATLIAFLPYLIAALAGILLIPPLVVGVKIGFDFFADLISYHFPKKEEPLIIDVHPSYSIIKEDLNTTSKPTPKVEESPSLLDKFYATTIGLKLQNIFGFLAGSSPERIQANFEAERKQTEESMFPV